MANAGRLAGCRILVVEDDWLISCDLDRLLTKHGAIVIGPVATVEEALDLMQQDEFQLAIINVKLGDQLAYPLADELRRRNISFAFASGYSAQVLPAPFSDVPFLEKPCDANVMITEAQRLCALDNEYL